MTPTEKKLQNIIVNAYNEVSKLPNTPKTKRIKKKLEESIKLL